MQTYGWFVRDGKKRWGFVISEAAGLLVVEDAQNCAKHYTVQRHEFNAQTYNA